MGFSKFFKHIGNSDTGQYLLTNYLLLFYEPTQYQASAYEKQERVTIACLITKFRGYRHVKSQTPPTK